MSKVCERSERNFFDVLRNSFHLRNTKWRQETGQCREMNGLLLAVRETNHCEALATSDISPVQQTGYYIGQVVVFIPSLYELHNLAVLPYF